MTLKLYAICFISTVAAVVVGNMVTILLLASMAPR